jgi:hypothetical protein
MDASPLARSVESDPKRSIARTNVPGGRNSCGKSNDCNARGYFVIIRRGAVLGACSAGEITNVTHPFQPAGRFWLANSQ